MQSIHYIEQMIGLPLVVCDKSKKGVDEDEDEDDGEDKRDSDLRKTDRRLKRKLNLYLITYRTTVKPKRTNGSFQ